MPLRPRSTVKAVYKIMRNGGRTVIMDWNGKAVFSTEDDAYVLYRDATSDILFTSRVADLNDAQLLQALATLVKLDL